MRRYQVPLINILRGRTVFQTVGLPGGNRTQAGS